MAMKAEPALDLAQNGTTAYANLTAGFHTLATRVGQGFSEITGYIRVTAGAGNGTLYVEQSADWFNWDQQDTWAVIAGAPGTTLPFAVKVIAKFVRIRYQVPGGSTHSIRFGGLMKVGASP